MTEPLFLVSHGRTSVSEKPGEQNYTPEFDCPPNITIHFFETVGKELLKLDGGLLCNLLSSYHQKGNLFKLLESLNGKKFKTPYAKNYCYCKKYTTGNVVPNIIFQLKDPVTQLGVFTLKRGDGTPHYVEFDTAVRNPEVGPQWDIQFDADKLGSTCEEEEEDFEEEDAMDIDGEKKRPCGILGKKITTYHPYRDQGGKQLFQYKKIEHSLYDIASKASEDVRPRGINLDLIIISCRDFISPKLEEVSNTFADITSRAPSVHNNFVNLINNMRAVTPMLNESDRIKLNKNIVKIYEELTTFINELASLPDKAIKGYHEFQNYTINFAIEDLIRDKPTINLPEDMDLYIPDIPGNVETRANPASVFGQLGGNIYSKITCPITGKEVNVKSKKGLEIVKKYSKYYNAK